MGDYYDHCLKKGVLLLADVLEKFIDACLKSYGIDPCHYFNPPGLSWDTMLKITGTRLEKNVHIDMYLFNEKGLRAGISYITKRYSKANNKCIKNYDPKKPSIFINYLDMNNLYGWAMGRCLPYGEFKWLKNVDNSDAIQSVKWVQYDINSNRNEVIRTDLNSSFFCTKNFTHTTDKT